MSAAQQRRNQSFDQRPLADDATVEPVHDRSNLVLLLSDNCLHGLPYYWTCATESGVIVAAVDIESSDAPRLD
jgi:hypothetical protein